MQPTLVFSAPVDGLVYINGRLAGETRQDLPLMAPAAPFGPVFWEFRPFSLRHLPMAGKIVLSGGAPLGDSLTEGVFAICWPGSITEIELSPLPLPDCSRETLRLGGHTCRFFRGRSVQLEIGGVTAALPENAEPPEMHRIGGCIALTGCAGEGRYLLLLSGDASRQTGFLLADRIDFESPEFVSAVHDRGDFAGHRTLERWRIDADGLTLVLRENRWTDGLPRRPATPEETVRAAAEAALLGRFEEAESYFHPSASPSLRPEDIPGLGDLCLPVKYALPGGSAAAALLHAETDCFAKIVPLYCRAERLGGEWRLTDLYADA